MDGRISLLHVGDVNVVGMTLTQLADYLKKLYATVYADPVITAVLMQSNSRRYTVMGQVNQPGVFPLDYPIAIVQSIARSGGFTEWAKRDITVNCVAPGLVDTEMLPAEVVEEAMKMIPLRRVGRPQEVAAAVAYLMSDDAAYVTRQVISVNGGLVG